MSGSSRALQMGIIVDEETILIIVSCFLVIWICSCVCVGLCWRWRKRSKSLPVVASASPNHHMMQQVYPYHTPKQIYNNAFHVQQGTQQHWPNQQFANDYLPRPQSEIILTSSFVSNLHEAKSDVKLVWEQQPDGSIGPIKVLRRSESMQVQGMYESPRKGAATRPPVSAE